MLNIQDLKIAIIEDHVLVRHGISEALTKINEHIKFVIEADNGLDFITQFDDRSIEIDLVLVDLEMDNMDGFETIKWLKSHSSNIKILVLTQVTDEFRIREALKLGIDGFFDKFGKVEDLNSAINNIALGGSFFPGYIKQIQHKLMNGVSIENMEAISTGVFFTEEEINLIRLCYRGFYNKEISKMLNLSDKSIEFYLNKLYKKMKVTNRVEMIRYALMNQLIQVKS
jgi:DNA-binding NarL/FixJ family response regulator